MLYIYVVSITSMSMKDKEVQISNVITANSLVNL